MDFLITKNIKNNSTFSLLYSPDSFKTSNNIYISDKNKSFKFYNQDKKTIIVIGDLVSIDQESFDSLYEKINKQIINELNGFFYLIYIDENVKILKVFSSLFNILPIYYSVINDYVYLSSKITLIADKIEDYIDVDEQYILERYLFNYSLFNRTYFKQISTIKANHFVEVSDKITERKIFDISNLFVPKPQKGQKVIDELVDYFMEEVSSYLPNDYFSVSFTGGFDGRTLVALSKYYNRNFFTYSFGAFGSEDIDIPRHQASKLSIEYIPLHLDDNYIDKSYNYGLELMNITEGHASLNRSHYLYAMEQISKKTNVVLSGTFGSELFRALHIPGVVISKNLVNFFAFESKDAWIKSIKLADEWKFLKKSFYKKEFECLIEELYDYHKENSELTRNRFFYKFVFDEIFRKYFGPEIIMQQYYLNSRCPYINFNFIQKLLKTIYCGVYSDFFSNNPIRRFKGQILYAHIIRKSCSEIFSMKTGKGYSPSNLLSNTGKLILIKNFLSKKINLSSNKEIDQLSVEKVFRKNLNKINNIKLLNNLHDNDFFKKSLNSDKVHNRDLIYTIFSLNAFLSKYFN